MNKCRHSKIKINIKQSEGVIRLKFLRLNIDQHMRIAVPEAGANMCGMDK